jgi:hypothetical protein
LPPPLGYKGIQVDQGFLMEVLGNLNIKDHQGKVYYPEVMWSIFHSVIGVVDNSINKCEQVTTILLILKQKYPDLPKKLTLQYLCGLKYNHQDITVSKWL